MVIRKFLPIILYLALGIVIALGASSCQKSPINGDLDGQWQIMSVEPEPSDMIIDENLYYCFSLHVCQLTYYGNGYTSGILAFDGNSISLSFPNLDMNNDRNIKLLRQYGIYSNPVVFQVDYLDKDKLIMKSEESRVILRKF